MMVQKGIFLLFKDFNLLQADNLITADIIAGPSMSLIQEFNCIGKWAEAAILTHPEASLQLVLTFYI